MEEITKVKINKLAKTWKLVKDIAYKIKRQSNCFVTHTGYRVIYECHFSLIK